RYSRIGDQYYTYTSYHSEMWEEYFHVFDEVILLDKTEHLEKIPVGQKPVLTDKMSFIEFPSCKGFFSLLCGLPRMLRIAKNAVKKADVWSLHAPDIGSFCLWFWAWFYKIPYVLELRADQALSATYLKLRNVRFARIVAISMRIIIWLQRSNPLLVVSVSRSLVRDFPPRNNCPSFVISDNRIPANWYGSERTWNDDDGCRTIVCVGRLEAQKNPFGTMRALAGMDQMGFNNWRFVWVGDGPFRRKTQELAEELGLSEKVDLMGFVPWDDVFSLLDRADLFLLNSVSEGLPRALVEGMARGLPAIGTDVGGIPELLDSRDVIPMTDDETLARKLCEVLSNSKELAEMSKRNLETAGSYAAEILSVRKIAYYKRLKQELQELHEKDSK
ncbi:MAG: glycosyltransferase, partial [Planctomycetes bacterium]|nr:glycosyltransferase [Planctomycetota bacterium]